MKARWFVPAALLVATASPARAQFAIDLAVGPNWSQLSTAPTGYTTSSDIGYYLGGRIRFPFASLFYIAPGLDYQYQSFILDNSTLALNDNVGISSFMIPLELGVNLNAKVVAVQLGVAGTVAFNTSVNDNNWGVTKDITTNTRWGYMLHGSARILALIVDLSWQSDLTNTFQGATTIPNGGGNTNDGKLSQFRVGIGIGL